LEGAHVEGSSCYFWLLSCRSHLWRDFPLAILGVDHILSCGELHLLGTLHIHPWSWLPWDSDMWISCMLRVDLLLFLEEVVVEHSLRMIIILFILPCILEGALSAIS
jgi:hypothetical protein